METYIAKLKHILPTFITVTFGTVFGLGFIRWLFSLKLSIIDFNEEVWIFWLPLIIPWIPIIRWLRPRFRILIFKDKNNGRSSVQIIAWFTIAAMLSFSQAYLATATGKLQKLSTIKDIAKVEKSRYYELTNFSLANYYAGTYTDFRKSGKYNQYFNFEIFFVTPILKDTAERINDIPKYWCGVKFKEQISNKISSDEKKKKYQVFYAECIEKMNKYEFSSLDHFERSPTSDDQQNYLKAIEARTKLKADNSFIVLEPIIEKYEDRNGNNLTWVFRSFGIGLSFLLFALISPGYSETERRRFLSDKKPKQDYLVNIVYVPKAAPKKGSVKK